MTTLTPQQITEKIQAAQRQADQAIGRAQAAQAELKAMGYNTKAEAEAALAALLEDVKGKEQAAKTAMESFMQKWGDKLEGIK